jgi:peptidoglycan L-alanyl-D-glutamate endopeptidase CwlK
MTDTFAFGGASSQRLATTDLRIQHIMEEALRTSLIDFGIPSYGGMRTAEEQGFLYLDGKSKCDGVFKKSYHQSGKAVDIFPYIGGRANYDKRYCFFLAGHILATAKRLGYELTWGGDFDGDLDFDDQTFQDLVHYQLKE